MSIPADLKYRSSHEWIRLEDGVATVGITHHAQDQLGDVVYVDMPELGDTVAKGDSIAEVESTKTVSDIYAPVSGRVVEINEALDGGEELVNKEPYGGGWLFKIEVSDASELGDALDAAGYQAVIEAD